MKPRDGVRGVACFHGNPLSGFTFLELIIVISLMLVVYTVAAPSFSTITGSEEETKLGGVASDVRGAYDMAVLHRRPYRLVFYPLQGVYWLETTFATDFTLGDAKINRDLTEEEIKDQNEIFDEDFENYKELAGTEVEDPDNDRVIPPVSPVLKAKDRLKNPEWIPVDDREWKPRQLAPQLFIFSMQAEHHDDIQLRANLPEKGRVMIYFFPNGYAERAYIHIGVGDPVEVLDPNDDYFTVITDPYTGTADVRTGYEQVDLREEIKAR